MKNFAAPTLLAATLICVMAAPAIAGGESSHADEIAQARAVVNNLITDNSAFVKKHKNSYFAPLIKGQQPRATLVTCSDSRVHTHALDRTPDGDLFMVRDIGNQHATGEGSIEYGVRHLHTPVLMFIGHSSCGAVKAAMGGYEGIEPAIKKELDTLIVPGKNPKDDQEVMASVEANVNNQVASALKKYDAEVKAGTLTVIGAVYDFRNDYKQGNGRLVVVNLNGETDRNKIKQAPVMQKK